MTRCASILVVLSGVVCAACGSQDYLADPPDRLSDFGLFVGDVHAHSPAPGVVPYDVNTPLFSDYSHKFRFIQLPEGKSAVYHPDLTFDLPAGTILSKTFSFPVDEREPEKGWRHVETRLLIRGEGGWGALTYVWNRGQRDGYLEVAGDDQVVSWVDKSGLVRVNDYMIPNTNQCKQCHIRDGEMLPIGVKARFLNKAYAYPDVVQNQLSYWSEHGMLTDGPLDVDEAPRLAVWDDPATGNVERRSRAYLEANCAHCHSPGASAWSAGLDLRAATTDPTRFGVYKTATAAGRGTGERIYDVVPGDADASILIYRLASTEPDIAMPELARREVDHDAVALLSQWINEMPKSE